MLDSGARLINDVSFLLGLSSLPDCKWEKGFDKLETFRQNKFSIFIAVFKMVEICDRGG